MIERLTGGPVCVGHDYTCYRNNLADLDGVADQIGWDLVTDIRLNHVTSNYNAEEKYGDIKEVKLSLIFINQ